MSNYEIKISKHQEIAEETIAFYFTKPENFEFKAGQYCEFILPSKEGSEKDKNAHMFSLANPPYSKDLMIATRLRDTAYKHTLQDLPKNAMLSLRGPYGSFTLHNNSDVPAVFLTGGIGITPVRSIVLQAAKNKLPHHIYLFYSNHRPEDSAFLEELAEIENTNPYYKFIGTMTNMAQSQKNWSGETGYINHEMLSKYLQDLKRAIYYISGPATMVNSMRETLNSAGVDDDNIRTEEFAGY